MTKTAPKLTQLSQKSERILFGPPETNGMRSGHVVLAQNEESGRHSTNHYEELLIFRSGAGVVKFDNDAEIPVTCPATLYIPPDTWHNVKNTHKEPLDYIYVVAPTIHWQKAPNSKHQIPNNIQ